MVSCKSVVHHDLEISTSMRLIINILGSYLKDGCQVHSLILVYTTEREKKKASGTRGKNNSTYYRCTFKCQFRSHQYYIPHDEIDHIFSQPKRAPTNSIIGYEKMKAFPQRSVFITNALNLFKDNVNEHSN